MFGVTPVSASRSRISSRQHPVVRAFREAAREVHHSPTILLDGAHLIREALASGAPVRTVLATPEFLSDAPAADRQIVIEAARIGADVYEGTPAVLDAASPVRMSSGIVALAEWRSAPVAAVFTPAPALAVALFDVQDPGNVGAVIRSADAFGATGVLALDRTAHPGGWKALRGAMGSTFHLPVCREGHAHALSAARAAGACVLAATARGGRSLEDIDFGRAVVLLLGNEGGGLTGDLLAAADGRVSIPMRAGVESLNVAVTAAVLLYEARKQRR